MSSQIHTGCRQACNTARTSRWCSNRCCSNDWRETEKNFPCPTTGTDIDFLRHNRTGQSHTRGSFVHEDRSTGILVRSHHSSRGHTRSTELHQAQY